jgi:hypothetical protein
VGERNQIAIGLILGPAQLRVEGTEHEIERGEEARLEVALALGREIHLDAAQDPEAGSARSELVVQCADLVALARERRRVHAPGDREADRVVRDREVRRPTSGGGFRHLAHRAEPSLPSVCDWRSPRTSGSARVRSSTASTSVRVRNPLRIAGGSSTRGGAAIQSSIRCASHGPIARRSASERPCATSAVASSLHRSAARPARRSARRC